MYRLVVPASDGIWSPCAFVYKVYLLPYVYDESGFGVGCVSVCIVVCGGIHYYTVSI